MVRKVMFGLIGLVVLIAGCGDRYIEHPPDKSVVRVFSGSDSHNPLDCPCDSAPFSSNRLKVRGTVATKIAVWNPR